MTTPNQPVPALAEKWLARSRYLRWADAAAAWLVLLGAAAAALPTQPGGALALLATALLVAGVLIPATRIHWRPVSGWTGVAVSRSLRPGSRAWFVRGGRADPVLVTGRRGLRVSIAERSLGEAETMTVRRTRVFLIPADAA
jgi:hypothetical protein